MRFRSCVALIAWLSCTACVGDPSSSGDPNDTATPTQIRVVLKGELVALQVPFFSQNLGGQFTAPEIHAYSSQSLLNGALTSGNSLGTGGIPGDVPCLKAGCLWVMAPDSNNLQLPFGIVTNVADGSGYVSTAVTTAVSNAMITAKEPNQAITNLVTFALPTDTLTTLATAIAQNAATVTKEGMVIGIVVDRQSSATSQKHYLPAPIQGASVSLPNAPDATLYTVTDDYSSASPFSNVTTNKDGLFLAVGSSTTGGKAQTLAFKVTATGHTWRTQTTGLVPGYITISVFYAS